MCRLLAAWGEDLALRSNSILDGFRNLAAIGKVPAGMPVGHKDGWGLTAFQNERIALFRKKPAAADEDDDYQAAARDISNLNPTLIVAHLRKSSMGRKHRVNAHPFLEERFVFCHNGSVLGSDLIPLDDHHSKMRKGGTDSEKLFLYLLQLMKKEEAAAVVSAIVSANYFVRSHLDYTALNFLLTDGKALWAVREVNEHNDFVRKFNLCNDYYSLYQGASSDGRLKFICSEPFLPDINWGMINNHSISKRVMVPIMKADHSRMTALTPRYMAISERLLKRIENITGLTPLEISRPQVAAATAISRADL